MDAATRWEELISAGNDPDSVIDLINGKITMAEFLEINKDVKVAPKPTGGEEPSEDNPENPENPTPGDYYDPDRGDYSTPRDEKETPADKKKEESEAKVQKALEILSKEPKKIELDQISNILAENSYKLTKKLTKEVEKKVNSVYSEEKDRVLSEIFPDNKDFNTLEKKERLKAQKKLDQIDYGKLNSELIK